MAWPRKDYEICDALPLVMHGMFLPLEGSAGKFLGKAPLKILKGPATASGRRTPRLACRSALAREGGGEWLSQHLFDVAEGMGTKKKSACHMEACEHRTPLEKKQKQKL